MPRIHKALLFALFVDMFACQTRPNSPAQDISGYDKAAAIEAAKQTVARYLSADTAGAGLADSIDVLILPCEGDRATDGVAPVFGANIVREVGRKDTVYVTVEYQILGSAQSWDESELKSENWRFVKNIKMDVDTMAVIQDRAGHSQILCGPYHGNHWARSVMKSLVAKFDSSSRVAWSSALQEAARRWPE